MSRKTQTKQMRKMSTKIKIFTLIKRIIKEIKKFKNSKREMAALKN